MTPAQEKEMNELVKINQCAKLLAEIAHENGTTPTIASSLVIFAAEKKFEVLNKVAE